MTPGPDTLAAYLDAYSRTVLLVAVMLPAAVAVRRAVTARPRPIPMEQT